MTCLNTEHASAIEETAASMEEMTAMVTQANTNANSSLALARDAEQQVEKGKEIVGQMNVAMQQIQVANTKLSAILGIIEDIRSKTTIINDIVFETRLLSFNASIEAARAGIHGKGFAVVAEEVGKLASLSGKAAGEIRTLLDSSVTEVNHIIGTTQEKVTAAKGVTEQCGQAFFSMAEGMRQIADAMEGITTASRQQEQGIRETNRAMMDIAHVTQKNSSSAEKMLAQVTSLGQLVQSFTETIMNLRLFISGDLSENLSRPSKTGSTPKAEVLSFGSASDALRVDEPSSFGMEEPGSADASSSLENFEDPGSNLSGLEPGETSGSLSAEDLEKVGAAALTPSDPSPNQSLRNDKKIKRNDKRWKDAS
ncbi:MAG: hypothetical protein HYX41_03425 [Bdellovibrio sp.]|nr:hypothetical protein [Bdellovibrio sp.]